MDNPAPTRTVHEADALVWLSQHALAQASVITSLPDISELHSREPRPATTSKIAEWQTWFEAAAELTMRSVPEESVAIFFQSDIRHNGLWVDKGAMITRAAERAGVAMLFHKIVCRRPPGTLTFGRASYSHLLGFSRALRPKLKHHTADILLDAGEMPSKKSMGVRACVDACRFVLAETDTRTIVDPFCGFGTVLAVANEMGLHAIGVDLSPRMCKKARNLKIQLP